MARIIILAEPSELLAFVEHALIQEGYFVRLVHDGALSASKINALLPDLVIVDASSPASATHELCVRIQNRYTVGRRLILILGSAADASAWGVSALGYDAYLERPLEPRTLLARVQALLGTKVLDDSKPQILVADLVIDPATYRVFRSGKLLSLTLLEFRLLYYFASHPNTVCRRDQLLHAISSTPRVKLRGVDVYVRHLRMKIEEDEKQPRLIRSVRAQGYRFHVSAFRPSTLLAQDGRALRGVFNYDDPAC